MAPYRDHVFRKKLEAAMSRCSEMLESSIRPVELESEAHAYGDKFEVANFVTSLAVNSVYEVLGELGVEDAPKYVKKAVLLEWWSTESCEYSREQTRTIQGPKVTVSQEKTTTKPGVFSGVSKSTTGKETSTQVSATFQEFVWTHSFEYGLRLVDAVSKTPMQTLWTRSRSCELFTRSKDVAPKPARVERLETFDLRRLDLPFSIDRDSETCRTPRRNEQVELVLDALFDLAAFAASIYWPISPSPLKPSAADVFSPPACLFIGKNNTDELVALDAEPLMAELRRTLTAAQNTVKRAATEADNRPTDKAPKPLLGPDEHAAAVCLSTLRRLHADYDGAVNHLEYMLYAQLEAAVSKHLTAADFDEYCLYHDRSVLYARDFAPKPFCRAVRRSADAFPDGLVALETAPGKPVQTLSRVLDETWPIQLSLDAATSCVFEGERVAHAYVAQTFAASKPNPLRLVASARQFSGYILLLGNLAAKDQFVPEHAIVIKNKDQVVIPILLDPLPTPKAFADAIESLSPEQREFCKAFRAMQLASSLFAVLVVQLKPQIEAVLNLPSGSLVKEIQLTEELMDLCSEYQIPTSLLSYDGPREADPAFKLDAVKRHAQAVRDMIDAARKADVDKALEEAKFRAAEEAKLRAPAEMECRALYKMSGPTDLCEISALRGSAPRRSEIARKACSVAAPRSERVMATDSKACKTAEAVPRYAAVAYCRAASAKMPVMAAPSSMAPPAPKPELQQQQEQPREEEAPEAPEPSDESQRPQEEAADTAGEGYDLTKLPSKLDARFKVLDTDSQLRPTTVKASTPWDKTSKKSILAAPTTAPLDGDALAKCKRHAFDLLDALTRSGGLPLQSTSLHVIVAATHAFDKSIVDTIVQDNVDPILKHERSSLIIASTLHDLPVPALVAPQRLPAIQGSSPLLLQDSQQEDARTPADA